MQPPGDGELLRIVDEALADATRRGGPWLVCKPGCTPCCTGVFRISQLDAARLRDGAERLAATDPASALALQQRVRSSQARLQQGFPGDATTGALHMGAEADDAFEEFANDEVCPVLESGTGTCSLYAHRPMTCRTFGPPVKTEDGSLGVCELCFQGATEEQVSAAEMHLPSPELETALTQLLGQEQTIVTFAFIGQFDPPRPSEGRSDDAARLTGSLNALG